MVYIYIFLSERKYNGLWTLFYVDLYKVHAKNEYQNHYEMTSSFEMTLKLILWIEIYSWGHGLVKRSFCGWSTSPLLGKVQALWICSLSLLSSIRHHCILELYKKIIFFKGFIFNTTSALSGGNVITTVLVGLIWRGFDITCFFQCLCRSDRNTRITRIFHNNPSHTVCATDMNDILNHVAYEGMCDHETQFLRTGQ